MISNFFINFFSLIRIYLKNNKNWVDFLKKESQKDTKRNIHESNKMKVNKPKKFSKIFYTWFQSQNYSDKILDFINFLGIE